MTWETQLIQLEALLKPVMQAHGLESFCRADLWLDHPAMKSACAQGGPLFATDPRVGLILPLEVFEAITAAIPTPGGQGTALWCRILREERASQVNG